jgi:hypothetical protein
MQRLGANASTRETLSSDAARGYLGPILKTERPGWDYKGALHPLGGAAVRFDVWAFGKFRFFAIGHIGGSGSLCLLSVV